MWCSGLGQQSPRFQPGNLRYPAKSLVVSYPQASSLKVDIRQKIVDQGT